jgi:hypothetical protein
VLLEDLQTLKEITKNGIPKGKSRDQAINLLRKLREKGFTNNELSEFIDPAWSVNSIKRFTRGVEVKDMTEKNSLMNSLASFAESGNDIQDMEDYLRIRGIIPFPEVSFRQLSSIYDRISGLDMPLEIALEYVKKIYTETRTPEELEKVLVDLHFLKSKGLDKATMGMIADTLKGGELVQFLKAIKDHQNLKIFWEELKRKDEELREIELLIKEKQNTLESLKLYVDYTQILLSRGFDRHAFHNLYQMLEKYGRPGEVLEAFNKYQDIKQLEQVITELTEKRNKVCEEYRALDAITNSRLDDLERISRRIGYIKADYDKSFKLAQISELIVRNGEIRLSPFDVKGILLAVIYGARREIANSPKLYIDWNLIDISLQSLISSLEGLQFEQENMEFGRED